MLPKSGPDSEGIPGGAPLATTHSHASLTIHMVSRKCSGLATMLSRTSLRRAWCLTPVTSLLSWSCRVLTKVTGWQKQHVVGALPTKEHI